MASIYLSQSDLYCLKYEKGLNEGQKVLVKVARVILNGEPICDKIKCMSRRQLKFKGFNPYQIKSIENGTLLEKMDYTLVTVIIRAFGSIPEGSNLLNYIKSLKLIRNIYAHEQHNFSFKCEIFTSKLNDLKSLCMQILLELKSYCDPATAHMLDQDSADLEGRFLLLTKPSEVTKLQRELNSQPEEQDKSVMATVHMLDEEEEKGEKEKLMTIIERKVDERSNQQSDMLLSKFDETMNHYSAMMLSEMSKINEGIDQRIKEGIDQRIKEEAIIKDKLKSDECFPNESGRILFFNFIKFDASLRDECNISNRDGAESDSVTIKKTFTLERFHGKYKVNIYESKTYEETLEICENLRKDSSLKEFDSLMIFISSHGLSQSLFCTRNKVMNLDTLRRLFYENKHGCRYLKEKAKIFFANYCQGDGEEYSDSDSDSESIPSDLDYDSLMIGEGGEQEGKKIKGHRNMLTIFSTIAGAVAWREDEDGNYFLQKFCKVLKENQDMELNQLISRTNSEVEVEIKRRNTFSQEGSSFKHFYFGRN